MLFKQNTRWNLLLSSPYIQQASIAFCCVIKLDNSLLRAWL